MKFFGVLLFLSLVSYSTSIRWIKKLKPDQIYFGGGIKEFQVDDGEPNVLIRKLKSLESSIKIQFSVENYIESNKVKFQFCRRTEKLKCNNVIQGGTYQRLNPGFLNKYEINKTLNIITLIVTLKIVRSDQDLTGRYICRAYSSFNKVWIETNDVDIRDVYWWKGKYLKIPKPPSTKIVTKEISRNTMPYKLDCDIPYNEAAPNWVRLEYTSNIKWFMCTILDRRSLPKKMCMNEINPSSEFVKNINRRDGTIHVYNQSLTLLNIDNLSIKPNSTISFVCYMRIKRKNVPLRYFLQKEDKYSIKLGIKVDLKHKVTNDLHLIDPTSSSIKNVTFIRKNFMPELSENSNANAYYLIPKYRARTPVICQFYFNDKVISNSSVYQVKYCYLKFINAISRKMAGIYKFKITTKTGVTSYGKFNLQIVSIPTLITKHCLQRIYYIDENESLTINCVFEKSSVNEMRVIIDNRPVYKHVVKGKVHKFYPSSGFINMLYKIENKNIHQISYQLSQMNHTQDHMLTIIAANEVGSTILRTSIYVVPKLRFYTENLNNHRIYQSPNNSNCDNSCNRTKIHSFKCNIMLELYQNKELDVNIYWDYKYKNGRKVQRISHGQPKPFELQNKSRILILNQVDKNDKLLTQLKNTYLVCHLTVRGVNYSYESPANCADMNELCSKINLSGQYITYLSAGISKRYWFIVLILSIIVLVIVFVLIIKFLQIRRGDTYKLDKLERQLGYDHEKEIQDEMFKPYEPGDSHFENEYLNNSSIERPPCLNCEDDIEIDIKQYDEYAPDIRQYHLQHTQDSERL